MGDTSAAMGIYGDDIKHFRGNGDMMGFAIPTHVDHVPSKQNNKASMTRRDFPLLVCLITKGHPLVKYHSNGKSSCLMATSNINGHFQ